MTTSVDALVSAGQPVDQIPVRINYRIIELFSRGLYSSPHKALEELVSNSYDALAQHVWLLVPSDLADPSETIWVVDDGESMDLPGLHQLWLIASSNKRDEPPPADRPPIGKFGIGKLATYVLARQLTYVCRRSDRVLAVTMDYGRINPDIPTDEQHLLLAARELSTADMEAALRPMRSVEGGAALYEHLLSADAPTSWTAAAMSNLTPAVADLKLGRIRWLMSTALPKSPAFNLQINGRPVPPSVDKRATVMTQWKIGENSAVLPPGIESGRDEQGPYVAIDGLDGRLRGSVALYEDVLTKGKAERMGHSHGFFVKVRGRLVNIDDPLFGMPALSHATFNRFRLEVDADGLDSFLASTREAVIKRGPVELFQEWLKAEFNAARGIWDSWAARRETDTGASARVGATSASLSRRPLVAAVRAMLTGEIPQLLLVSAPLALDAATRAQVIRGLEESLESPDGPIKDVRLEPLGVDRYVAAYDPVERIVRVNTLHPFFASFVQTSASHSAFEMIAVAEVLTEAYLVEQTGDAEVASAVVARRDAFLRELVAGKRDGPAAVSQYLLDQAQNPAGLEEAVADALRSLGFQVSPTDGRDEPDGIAVASVGGRALDPAVEEGGRFYTLIFEAKATVGRSVAITDVNPTRVHDWRLRANADYALVVAPKFRELTDRSSRLGRAFVDSNVTPIEIADLALLVQVAAVRQLGFSKLADWLRTCRTGAETHEWIQAQLAQPADRPVLHDLLSTIAELQAAGPDPVEVPALVALLRERGHAELNRNRVSELVRSVQSLSPGYLSFDGRYVVLETSLERAVDELRRRSAELPSSLVREMPLDPIFEDDSAS